ncbi:hypothetical protein KUTeg_004875 [Tegillarca granosa]|uniref:Uncharacterized protein n=1 Tax=Tegillarca granosa TaxID=220873 RepID=A0ABQ9FI54_TEGGR|nr:hypothetical protein KUTeg_004875 [Tegillarca granosa]
MAKKIHPNIYEILQLSFTLEDPESISLERNALAIMRIETLSFILFQQAIMHAKPSCMSIVTLSFTLLQQAIMRILAVMRIQAIMCIGGSLSLPYILTLLLCAEGQSDVTAKLLSITMFMSGVASLLQTTLGIRLPVIQGGSHTFVPPIVAMMTIEKFKCSTPISFQFITELLFATPC